MKFALILSVVFTSIFSIAQTHKCHTYELMQYQESQTPGYLDAVNESFARAKQSFSQDRSTVYTIPVVVHIVYNDSTENLDDSVIFNQIDVLNASFRRLNADTINLRDTFNTIVGDSYIEFELATVDPDGFATTGITRTSTSQTSFLGVGGFPAEGVKSDAEGGIDPWDQAHYLNIWVCNMSFAGTPFLLGYATPPNNLPNWPPGSADNMSDGVVIEFEAFGGNNPNTLDLGSGPMNAEGKTAVHEIGHYLGLRHIWADGDCSEEDGIDDTPNADDQSNQDCDIIKNTCTDAIGTLGDLPDMVENYMDYSAESCQNAFTKGQVDLMRGVLENERVDLIGGAVGIEDEKQLSFEVYPNPTNKEFTIVGLKTGASEMTIFNEAGQIIHQRMISSSTTVQALEPGLYFIQLSNETGIAVQKLIVY